MKKKILFRLFVCTSFAAMFLFILAPQSWQWTVPHEKIADNGDMILLSLIIYSLIIGGLVTFIVWRLSKINRSPLLKFIQKIKERHLWKEYWFIFLPGIIIFTTILVFGILLRFNLLPEEIAKIVPGAIAGSMFPLFLLFVFLKLISEWEQHEKAKIASEKQS